MSLLHISGALTVMKSALSLLGDGSCITEAESLLAPLCWPNVTLESVTLPVSSWMKQNGAARDLYLYKANMF